MYPSSPEFALKGLNISIRKGDSIGFVGPSGSGKSTLVDIVLGLLTPTSGEVQVDKKNIQTGLRSWQDQIGYVPQSVYLTDDTLRNNVAFGIPSDQIDEGAVARAVQAAQLDTFVANQPHGLDTVVGERGVRLSGGQLQRIGIARALYHDPSVLVLDEATSALDTLTEKGVMDSVEALQGSKTLLIVAHRLSTVEHCSRLYQLDRGRVIAEGAPAQLLQEQKAV
jgi:ABC-type multidrug transport system fused ATPase/permease subunit